MNILPLSIYKIVYLQIHAKKFSLEIFKVNTGDTIVHCHRYLRI